MKDFEKQINKFIKNLEVTSKEIGEAFQQPLEVLVSEDDNIEEVVEKEVSKVINDIFNKNFK